VDNYRPDAGTSLAFNYTYDPRIRNGTDALREAKSYINHTITQLFYTSNMVHDLYYRYVFDIFDIGRTANQVEWLLDMALTRRAETSSSTTSAGEAGRTTQLSPMLRMEVATTMFVPYPKISLILAHMSPQANFMTVSISFKASVLWLTIH
jgi:Fungalysin metallopeptidase (M36)